MLTGQDDTDQAEGAVAAPANETGVDHGARIRRDRLRVDDRHRLGPDYDHLLLLLLLRSAVPGP